MYGQVDQFLGYLKNEKGYSENTIVAYRNDLNQFVTFLKRVTRSTVNSWTEVDQQLVLAYGTHLEEQKYAASTIARKVASVKSFFSFMIGAAMLTDNPTTLLTAPRVEKRLPRILSPDEVESLLAEPAKATSPKALRDQALLDLLYATGLRVSEVVTLQMDDLGLEEAQIICEGRDGRARQLPLTPQAIESLSDYVEKGRKALLREREEATLFVNHRGHPLTRQGLWLIIKSYAEAAGVGSDVTPHTLRHSFAAHRLERGGDLQTVRELLGHANISTTQVYAQLIGVQNKESATGIA